MSCTLTVTTDLDPATAEERVRETLQAEGFGMLSEIDVHELARDAGDRMQRALDAVGGAA